MEGAAASKLVSLNTLDYDYEDLIDISRRQDLSDKVIVCWREGPTTKHGRPKAYVTVMSGSWCTISFKSSKPSVGYFSTLLKVHLK